MCLITFAYNCHPEYSFILLANRDEFYQRPSDPLGYWRDQPDILAGRDREKLGTWLGINTSGAFTAVTNYRDGSRPSKPLRSRGELTANYLSSEDSASTYAQQLEGSKAQYGSLIFYSLTIQVFTLARVEQQAHKNLSPEFTPSVMPYWILPGQNSKR